MATSSRPFSRSAGAAVEVLGQLGARDARCPTARECESAIARLEREGTLRTPSATAARGRLHRFAATWQEVQPSELLREHALRFLRVHELRAAGALQLAAAVAAAEGRPATLAFVCLDDRLAAAAEREGFPVAGTHAKP